MAWEAKYPKYGAMEINGKKVRLFSGKSTATTLEVDELVEKAVWEGLDLKVTLKNGKVRKYSNKFDFVTL